VVQVDPIKSNLKPPGTKRSKLKLDVMLSTSAFKFNLRRYNVAAHAAEFALDAAGPGSPPLPPPPVGRGGFTFISTPPPAASSIPFNSLRFLCQLTSQSPVTGGVNAHSDWPVFCFGLSAWHVINSVYKYSPLKSSDVTFCDWGANA